MEMKTTFSVGDTAYLVEIGKVFKGEVKGIKCCVNEKEGTTITYEVSKEICEGLFDKRYVNKNIEEGKLFLDKKEAKDFVQAIEDAKKFVDENEDVKASYITATEALNRNYFSTYSQ